MKSTSCIVLTLHKGFSYSLVCGLNLQFLYNLRAKPSKKVNYYNLIHQIIYCFKQVTYLD